MYIAIKFVSSSASMIKLMKAKFIQVSLILKVSQPAWHDELPYSIKTFGSNNYEEFGELQQPVKFFTNITCNCAFCLGDS